MEVTAGEVRKDHLGSVIAIGHYDHKRRQFQVTYPDGDMRRLREDTILQCYPIVLFAALPPRLIADVLGEM